MKGTLLNAGKMKEALAVCAREDMSKSYLGHLLSAGLMSLNLAKTNMVLMPLSVPLKRTPSPKQPLQQRTQHLGDVGSTALSVWWYHFWDYQCLRTTGAEGGRPDDPCSCTEARSQQPWHYRCDYWGMVVQLFHSHDEVSQTIWRNHPKNSLTGATLSVPK